MLSGGWDQPDLCRLLFEDHPEPMWIYDVHSLRFLAVNHAAVQQYGYSKEEFAAMTISQLQAVANDEVKNISQHRRRDGSLLQVEITSHPLTYEDRAANLIVARDVSERVQLESETRNFDVMFEQMADPVMLFDGQGRVQRMNHAARSIFMGNAPFTPGAVS